MKRRTQSRRDPAGAIALADPAAASPQSREESAPEAAQLDSASVVYWSDAAGGLFAPGSAGVKLGFKGDDGAWVAVHGKKQGVPLAQSKLGTLQLGKAGKARAIFEMEQATIAPAPVDPGGAPAPAGGAATTPVSIVFTGHRAGVLDDGTVVLALVKSWQPVVPGDLPEAIRTKLDERARIDLDAGPMWIWMSFALKDEAAERQQWVPPGHSKKEVREREALINAEIGRLPAGSEIRAAAERYARTIALVSTVEGGFAATAGAGDTYGSLGIFQWAMPRDSSDEAGSLGMFYRNLKSRAAAAEKKAASKRSDEDRLYLAAWAQCTAHGLDVGEGKILLGGEPANGGEVEEEMSAEMGEGTLRTYQLVAANDWIEQFRAAIVRPGPSGKQFIGHEYAERNSGGTITLARGGTAFVIEADAPLKVGDVFASDHAVSTAVILGVNRPNYVQAALWRALAPAIDAVKESDALLARVAKAVAAAAAKAGVKAKKSYTEAEIRGAGSDAVAALAGLKKLLWPPRPSSKTTEAMLEAEFRKQAIKLYAPADARKYHRERRFSTVEAASW